MSASQLKEHPHRAPLRICQSQGHLGTQAEIIASFARNSVSSKGNGIHDVHLNQGSTKSFIHRPGDDSNDHNDI